MTRWDNVALAVEQSLQVFVPAAASVPGVTRIEAKSSGPAVHFRVTADRPWPEVIADLETKLFARGHVGELPPLDYDITDLSESPSPIPGYVQVFPE